MHLLESLLNWQLAKKNYLQISAFFDLVVMEQRNVSQKKSSKNPQKDGKKDGWSDTIKPNF